MIERSEGGDTGKAVACANLFEPGLVLNVGKDRSSPHVAPVDAAKIERHQEVAKILVLVAEKAGVLGILKGRYIASERRGIELRKAFGAALPRQPAGRPNRVNQRHDRPARCHCSAECEAPPNGPCAPDLPCSRCPESLDGSPRPGEKERKSPSPDRQSPSS